MGEIAIVGGGVMGHGIALVLALAGHGVRTALCMQCKRIKQGVAVSPNPKVSDRVGSRRYPPSPWICASRAWIRLSSQPRRRRAAAAT